jgi:hypothetical protein
VKRLALSLIALTIVALCSACLTTTGGNAGDNPQPPAADTPQAAENRTPSSVPPSSVPPSGVPTDSAKPEQATLAFGKSYAWDDGIV